MFYRRQYGPACELRYLVFDTRLLDHRETKCAVHSLRQVTQFPEIRTNQSITGNQSLSSLVAAGQQAQCSCCVDPNFQYNVLELTVAGTGTVPGTGSQPHGATEQAVGWLRFKCTFSITKLSTGNKVNILCKF